ncbi:hypothetical protein JOC37_001715 [Desulfohalotomaculum tongense]|uniref:hypothetical protein n=1 Tax=Desulforadius tongensis TaxID=1216062 RepID=UPI001956F8BF|nr:hypothetical protein [Desulforadius tongensis]MBM7855322.1 hypothetical protein [Desulforadius tongensis]
MKIRYYLIALFLIILITVTACNGKGGKSDSYVTPEQVLNVFKQEGVKLIKSDKEVPSHLTINEVKPLIYQSTALNNQYLLVYVFNSFAKAKECSNYLHDNKLQFQNFDVFSPPYFKVKNIVLALAAENVHEFHVLGYNNITKIIFEKLHDTKKLVFAGEGEHWKANITVKYYEYYLEDENIYYDSYHTKKTVLTYKGNNESVTTFDYKCSDGSAGTGQTLNQDDVSGGYFSGNGSLPREEDTYTIDIHWNGKTESFKLKAITHKDL